MEYNPKLLPFKKRPYVLAFFQFQAQNEHHEKGKTEEMRPIDPISLNPELPRQSQILKTRNREEFDIDGSNCNPNYRPSKRLRRSSDENVQCLEVKAQKSVCELNALFDYIRAPFSMESESEVEWVRARDKKLGVQKKKKKGAWSRAVSNLNHGLKKLRKEKVMMGLGKVDVKALFGNLWTGNESFKWDIQHHTDPLSLPNFHSSSFRY